MQFNITAEIITLGVGFIGMLAAGAFTAGKLFQRMNDHAKRIEKGDEKDDELAKSLHAIESKLDQLIGKVSVILRENIEDGLTKANSPRVLNELGKKVLKESAIDKVLDPMFSTVVEKVRERNPENAYQAQEAVFEIVFLIGNDDQVRDAAERGAFLSGHSPDEVLYVGALNMRDKVLIELGFNPKGIDDNDPAANKHK